MHQGYILWFNVLACLLVYVTFILIACEYAGVRA